MSNAVKTGPRLGRFLLLALAGHFGLLASLWPDAPATRRRLELRMLPQPFTPPTLHDDAALTRTDTAPAATHRSRPSSPAAPASTTAPEAPPTPEASALPQPLQLPDASGQLDYVLLQDQLTGRARFTWNFNEGRYRLLLERELPGRTLPGWQSLGRITAIGLEPERFTVQRKGQDKQAVNFRRGQGVVSYSQSSALHALPGGVQDRLSWWLQLPALVAASKERLRVGDTVQLPLAPISGAPRDWRFTVTAVGKDGLWQLVQQDVGERPIQLDIWLDAHQQFLPVRMCQSLDGTPHWELIQAPDAPDP